MDHAMSVARPEQFADWLANRGDDEREVWVVIFKKTTGKQTVTFDQLLEVALCEGWVDVKTKTVDDERYAIRFVPRRANSSWSATNRATIRRLLADNRMRPSGIAVLPADLNDDA